MNRGFTSTVVTESLHREQATLVIVEQLPLLSKLFEQDFDLSVLELSDLLLTLVHQAAVGSQQDVPWMEEMFGVEIGPCPVLTDECKA